MSVNFQACISGTVFERTQYCLQDLDRCETENAAKWAFVTRFPQVCCCRHADAPHRKHERNISLVWPTTKKGIGEVAGIQSLCGFLAGSRGSCREQCWHTRASQHRPQHSPLPSCLVTCLENHESRSFSQAHWNGITKWNYWSVHSSVQQSHSKRSWFSFSSSSLHVPFPGLPESATALW